MALSFRRRSRRRRHAGLLALLALLALAAAMVMVLRSRSPAGNANTAAVTSGREPARPAHRAKVPTNSQLERARLFAAERSGSVSFAVIDTSGALTCFRCRARYQSASVVKAMLLVAYLNRIADTGALVPPDHEEYLSAMIRISDNAAASAIYADVGDRRLHKLAAEAEMNDFHVSGSWGSAEITAADQARFFARLPGLVAPEYESYARTLLSSIVREQSWGIPQVARPQWRTYFKGGWLTTKRGSLVH
jgi:hypothetical protein